MFYEINCKSAPAIMVYCSVTSLPWQLNKKTAKVKNTFGNLAIC